MVLKNRIRWMKGLDAGESVISRIYSGMGYCGIILLS